MRWLSRDIPNLVLADRDRDHDGRLTHLDSVRMLFEKCHSDRNGTSQVGLSACLSAVFAEAHVPSGQIFYIPGRFGAWLIPANRQEEFDLKDAKNAPYWIMDGIDQGTYLMLVVDWFSLEGKTHKGSHSVVVVGYRWQPSWGNSKIELKIVDPMHDYALDGFPKGQQYDVVTLNQRTVPGIRGTGWYGYEILNPNWESGRTKVPWMNLIGNSNINMHPPQRTLRRRVHRDYTYSMH